MTEGDLTTSPSPWGNDEAAQLMLELRNMQDSLRGMVLRVRRSSDEIVHSSSEIASGATDLSARTEQAAANLEESAASMEEISSTVAHTAEHTDEASAWRSHNADVATEGGRVMRDVVQTMESIRGRRRASARSSAPSTASPSRPTSWRSTRRSKPRAPASRAAASPWWPARCARWRSAAPRRRARSRR
jgi:methyl-accepting chemotaxis protein